MDMGKKQEQITKSKPMVKVYFETSGYAELVATFTHESTYVKCLPQLTKQALLMGFDRVTETIDEEEINNN